jgi:hypothetical protein
MRRYLLAAAAATLSIGIISVAGAGVAGAKSHKPTAVVATGSTTCHIHGTLSAAAGAMIAFSGNITPSHGKACSSNGGTKLRTGHLKSGSLASTATTTGVCTLLAGGTLPDVSGGTIAWSPRPKVAASTGVALTTGTVTVVTVGTDSYLQLAYSGGSVAGGSFTNASGGSFTATSNDTVATLTTECAAGPVSSISFHGSVTL